MADVHRFSEQMIELAERMANVADAAQGKSIRRAGIPTSWLLLPAAGAGLYAFAKSGVVARRATAVAEDVKTRASGLPDDLLSRARQAPAKPSTANGVQPSRRRTSTRRRTTTRASTRKSKSSSSAG
jgi:hypothetical protein